MKKIAKKLLVFVLALTVALSVATPLTVEAAVSYPQSIILYKTSKSTTSQYVSFSVSGLKKTDTIKTSSLKSSNTKVLEPNSVEMASWESSYKYTYCDTSIKPNTYSYKDYYAYLGFRAKTAGTATASYKVGSKTYKTKVTVKNYTNPIKTAQITGIKNGSSTNLAGKLKNQSYTNLKLTKDAKNATVKISAQSNWKIRNVEVTDYASGNSYRRSNSNGMSSVSLNVGTLKKNKSVYVRAEMFNTKDNGTITCYFYVN